MGSNRISVACNDKYRLEVEDKRKARITFFTPTYNRARFIPRVENCLTNQTCKDFVWIIVNDGSKDNTDEIAMSILQKEELPIKYISKPNGGKHSAFRAALEQCETSYFQCMDDDDLYFPGAVDFFLRKWSDIKKVGNEDIGAIRTLTKRPDGSYMANFDVKENEEYDADTTESYYILKRIQENWTCYDTAKLASIDLFKTYWMSECHKFVVESIWQTRFARKFKCRFVNVAFREYREDDVVSLTRAEKSRQHYLDVFLNNKVTLDEQIDIILKYDWIELARRIVLVNFFRDYLDIGFGDLMKNTDSHLLRVLYCLTWLPSLVGKPILHFAIRHR